MSAGAEDLLLLGGGRGGTGGEERNHFSVFHHASLPRVRRADPAGRVLAVPHRAPEGPGDPSAGPEAVGGATGAAAEGQRNPPTKPFSFFTAAAMQSSC